MTKYVQSRLLQNCRMSERINTMFLMYFIHYFDTQGVVTAATSLIENLVKKNPEEYKGCVSLAVSRLSRVSSEV